MKSPVILTLTFSILLAVIAFFLFPQDLLAPNLALAIGLAAGGIAVPFIVNLFVNAPSSDKGQSGNSTTLYVGNLPYRANEQAVMDHFSEQGKVFSVRLMKDRRTGKRKGYGFVEMDSCDADKVIRNLNDSEFQERTLKVRLAKEKVPEA